MTEASVVPSDLILKSQLRILVHINCRQLQEEIAHDNRMMHRQIIRMLNMKYADFNFDLAFWTRPLAFKESVFGDLYQTKSYMYPYAGLEYISNDQSHDIHIMVQRKGLTLE